MHIISLLSTCLIFSIAKASDTLSMERLFPKSDCLIEALNASHHNPLETPNAIYTNQVVITTQNGCKTHAAYYRDAKVVTIIDDTTDTFENGTQFIIYGEDPISMSTEWTCERINKLDYTKHIHNICTVYSTDKHQYVIPCTPSE